MFKAFTLHYQPDLASLQAANCSEKLLCALLNTSAQSNYSLQFAACIEEGLKYN
jgi:hypothetical protein